MSAEKIDLFTVAPRSFQVLLKEKGELKAAKSTDIICEVEGRSTIIKLVEEGTAVNTGDLLVELASDEIEERIRQEELKEANAIMAYEAAKTALEIQQQKNESDIRKADLDIELKQLELDKYRLGEWGQQLKDAQIAIDEARIQLDRRAQDFEDAKKLFERSFITRTEFEEDEFNWQKAKWGLEKAEKAKEVLVDYTHVAELRRRQSDLDEARKEYERVKKGADAEESGKVRALEGKSKELEITQVKLAELRAQKQKCRILAPGPGFVVYYSESWRWGGGDEIKEGAEVRERQIIMQLPDTSKMKVVARIHEAKTNKLRIGQAAHVEVEGVPGKRFTGEVSRIAVVADTQNRWLNPDLKEYETEVTLETVDQALKPGATAHVEILVERVLDKIAVPVQSIYTKGGSRYVFRDSSGGVDYSEVQLGSIGTEWAEVASGVSAGDSVYVAFSDEQTRLIPDLAPVHAEDIVGFAPTTDPVAGDDQGNSSDRGERGPQTSKRTSGGRHQRGQSAGRSKAP